MQDYTDPYFIEAERDKIVHEIVRAFMPELMKMESGALYCQFLRKEGLYEGPYADTPADRLKKFAQVAENIGSSIGPRMNATLDGSKSVFVPGMFKHAFNSAAADMNFGNAPQAREYKKAYKEGAKGLEQMAQSVSEAILHKDLNGALTAVYGRKWTDFAPYPDQNRKRDFD